MNSATTFTEKDLENIEVALRLRVEACEDNGDKQEASVWRRTWTKVVALSAKKDGRMTKAKLLKRLRELQKDSDVEAAHASADDALIEFIDDPEIKEAYEDIDKWYA